MSTILGNPIALGGGGAGLNIDFGSTPPADTTKLWVPLAKKPDVVECNPVVNYGDVYVENVAAKLPSDQTVATNVAAFGNKVYILSGSTSKNISVLDAVTDSISTMPDKLLYHLNYGSCQAVGDNIYIFYGSSNGSYGIGQKYNVTENSVSQIAGNISRFYTNSCVIGTDIYVSGGIQSGYYEYEFMRYDTVANTHSNTQMTPYAINGAMASIGNKIYYFGGSTSDGYTNKAYVFDVSSGTRTSIANLPSAFGYTSAISVGDNIYIFGGASGTAYSTRLSSSIIKYSTKDDTYTTIANMSTAKCNVRLAKVGQAIYFFGGANAGGTTGSWYTDIQKLVLATPLTNNHLFLQEDYGYDGLWTALKSKDADFKVKVINAYLGNSNNVAQLTNAYLYDSKDLKWKSLSGESYVADMQEALNIMGVN